MNERQKHIYKIIVKLGNASVEHLEREVFASSATIRRDLKKMENQGLITRVWGGAVLSGNADIDPPSFVRETENTEPKRLIARKALSFIKENDTIFLPSGSTVTELAKILGIFKNLNVITTCINVVNLLKTYSSFNVMVTGGTLYEHYDLVGPLATDFINKISADVLIFSCSGITENGFTSKDISRLEVLFAMQNNAQKKILLCDSSKVGKKYTYKGFPFEKIDYVIMDKKPDDIKLVKALGKKLIVV